MFYYFDYCFFIYYFSLWKVKGYSNSNLWPPKILRSYSDSIIEHLNNKHIFYYKYIGVAKHSKAFDMFHHIILLERLEFDVVS